MIEKEYFGQTGSGETVFRYTMKNSNGMRVQILNYGCIIQSIIVPDKDGHPFDVVLGYDDLGGYEAGSCFFGTFVGRYANRIKGACFTLNGKTYSLEKNDGDNHLHGAYCSQVFEAHDEDGSLILKRTSPDGEEGFPGTLNVEVSYTLTEDNALEIGYTAVTDADTVVNLTNHSYFNLNGDGGNILDHTLQLMSEEYTESDSEALPTGKILPVKDTPMDFRLGKRIGQDLLSDREPIKTAQGYDHNFILDGNAGTLRKFAQSTGDKSGITLEAFTTQVGVQFYTGNYIDGDNAPFGKGGIRYPRYAGFCLETQHYPCSPNFPEFPSTVLHPGEKYREKTVYKFKP